MISLSLAALSRLAGTALLLLLVSACSSLLPKASVQPTFYSLDGVRSEISAAKQAPAALSASAPTLIVNPTHAASGFDSQRLIYVREPHQLDYFAHHEWIDPPARMLAPLLVGALENTGAFRAVVLTPSAAAGDLRLDSEIIRLQHEFGTKPSQVHFTLRAYIVAERTRRILASQEFDIAIPSASEDPYGGVVAANRAVQTVLENLSAFCAEVARNTPIEK